MSSSQQQPPAGGPPAQQKLIALYLLKQQQLIALLRWHVPGLPPAKPSRAREKDNVQLLCGLLFSLKALSQKLRPSGGEPKALSFRGYSTAFYRLHCFESPTGLKCILLTVPDVPDLTALLKKIYTKVLVERVLRTVNCKFLPVHAQLVNECIGESLPELLQLESGVLDFTVI